MQVPRNLCIPRKELLANLFELTSQQYLLLPAGVIVVIGAKRNPKLISPKRRLLPIPTACERR